MTETVISALIGAGGAVLVCLITQFFVLKKTRTEMESAQNTTIMDIKHEMELIRYMLDELTKHVEKHNQVIERTYDLEKRCDLTDEQLKNLTHRLDHLEGM